VLSLDGAEKPHVLADCGLECKLIEAGAAIASANYHIHDIVTPPHEIRDSSDHAVMIFVAFSTSHPPNCQQYTAAFDPEWRHAMPEPSPGVNSSATVAGTTMTCSGAIAAIRRQQCQNVVIG
jgi:hypothetical protein